MPISGRHALPLATFNLPPRNDQNKRSPPPAATQKNAPQKARKILLPADIRHGKSPLNPDS